MPPPFIALDLHEFKQALDDWFGRQPHRKINAVHMHHTWRPNHRDYRGHETIVGMWRTHTRDNGWSDIAQHLSIAPDGTLWTGRHWDMPPASSSGANGTSAMGPFMFEMIGDFDRGKDPFQDPQRDAALWVVALVQKRFGLEPNSLKFHRQLGSPKTCPGTSIDYDEILEAVSQRKGLELPAQRAPRIRAGSYDAVVMTRGWLSAEPSSKHEIPEAEPLEEHGPADIFEEASEAAARGAAPLSPQVLQGLRAHVINMFGGKFSTGGQFQTDAADVARIFEEEVPRAVERLQPHETLPIVLYAHGGLVDEAAGLRIAANQIDWWKGNATYPIHFVWETGLFETIARMLGVQRAVARDLGQFTDPLVETVVRAAGGDKIWSGMKFSAARAFEPDGAGAVVVDSLAKLLRRLGRRVTLHAVGHSAGSIFHSYLLPSLLTASGHEVASLSLLAPAITNNDYKQRVDPHVGNGIKRLSVFTMAKDFELADTVTPAYRKSLLYLIKAALEPRVNEPIFGLEESLRADGDLSRRLGLTSTSDNAEVIWSKTQQSEGRRASQSTTHGGFDNDVATMESVLRRIRDIDDATQLAVRFPPDTDSRSAPASVAMPVSELAVSVSPDRGDAAQRPAPKAPAVAGANRRMALCIGIDAYPNPLDRLSGCVADARAWETALAGLGFTVARMHDAEATRDAILTRLTNMINDARPGDLLVFQFAGHGTQVEDFDRDEDDAQDEAFCPVDYAQGRLIIDDDFKGVFRRLATGIGLTCFFDSCHSGSVTRLAVGRTQPPPDSRPRFRPLTPAIIKRHRAFRATLPSSRNAADTSGPADMRQVVFAACKPEQVALESGGRGDFSLRAVQLLPSASTMTNAQFSDAVLRAFGPSPRQHPNLDCAVANRTAPFLGLPTRGTEQPSHAQGAGAVSRDQAVADLLAAAARLIAQTG